MVWYSVDACHAMHDVEQHPIMGNKPWLLPSNSDQFQALSCILGNQYIRTCQRRAWIYIEWLIYTHISDNKTANLGIWTQFSDIVSSRLRCNRSFFAHVKRILINKNQIPHHFDSVQLYFKIHSYFSQCYYHHRAKQLE